MDLYDPYNDPSGNAAFGAFLAIYIGVLAVSVLLGLAYYVVNAIAFGRFFRKVGLPQWTAWVPYYGNWKLLEVGGQPGWLVLLSLVGLSIVPVIFIWIGMYRLQIAFSKSSGHLAWGIILPPVWGFIMGADSTTYDPGRMVAAGYPPPLAGYGAVPRDPFGGASYAQAPNFPGQPHPGQPYAGQPYQSHPGYPQHPYAQPGYAQPGYAQPGYAQPGYPQPGYAQPGYPQPGEQQPGYGYPQGPGYPQQQEPGLPPHEQHPPQQGQPPQQ